MKTIILALMTILGSSLCLASKASAQVVRSEIYSVNNSPLFLDVYQQQFTTNSYLAFRGQTGSIFYIAVLDFLGFLQTNYQDCTRIGMPQSIALIRDVRDGGLPVGALVQCAWGLNSRWVFRLGTGAQAPLYPLTKLL